MDGVERLPYHLDEIAAQPNAENLYLRRREGRRQNPEEFSICATTASGGARWKDLAKHFRGRELIIVLTTTPKARRRARQAASALHKTAASIRIVTLPGLSGEKGDRDVSDWLNADKARASGTSLTFV